MRHQVNFEGSGWYADLGRYTDGENYVEGVMIATPDQFGRDGFMTKEYEDQYNSLDREDWKSPRIWEWCPERGTPYWLDNAPE